LAERAIAEVPPVRSIVFAVHKRLSPDAPARLLSRLETIPDVHRPSASSLNAKNPATRRMFYTYVADIESVRAQVAAQPEVGTASLPARQGLASTVAPVRKRW
jgi:hypothetical protein